jgi:hypothetical protein
MLTVISISRPVAKPKPAPVSESNHGEPINYQILSGMSSIRSVPEDSDLYMYADGPSKDEFQVAAGRKYKTVQLIDNYGQIDDPLEDNPDTIFEMAEGPEDDFLYAGGIKRMVANRRANKKEKLAQKRLVRQSKANARTMKADAKQTKAQAQQTSAKANVAAAKAIGQKDDSALAAALTQNQTTPTENKGLSKGAKWAIGGGIALVVVIGAVIVYKKVIKKGK